MTRSLLGWLNLVTVSLWLWTVLATVGFGFHILPSAAVTIPLVASVIGSALSLFLVVETVEAAKRR